MDKGFVFVLLAVGVLEIVLGFMNEKLLRNNYKDKNIKNLEGLIKWEKYSNFLLGIIMIIFAIIVYLDPINPITNYYATFLLVVFGISYFGRKRFK